MFEGSGAELMGREGVGHRADCPSINKQTALKGDMVVLSPSPFRFQTLQFTSQKGQRTDGGGVLISFRDNAPKDTKHSIAHLSSSPWPRIVKEETDPMELSDN